MTAITIGSLAPDFTLPTDGNAPFALSAHRGRPVVLEFYPEDDSGGCVTENEEFSQLLSRFKALGAVVVGISPDDAASHAKFRKKYGLKHILAADPERGVIEAYGLWGDKKMFGVEFKGLIRTTIIVDANGIVAGVIRATRIKGHAERVLEAVRALPAAY